MELRKMIALPLMLAAGSVFGQAATSTDTVKVTLDTIEVKPSEPQVYRASAPRIWDIRNTRIALTFNWKERTANAREWIKLHPYFYAADTVVLDAKGMTIDSVMLVDKKGTMTRADYTYKDDELRINFHKWYQSTDTIDLYLRYTARPYDNAQSGSRAITDDRGLYFINTDYKVPNKPAQIWTQGETESNSHWMVTIDKPNTRFTTQVELTVPDSFTTLSNGAMIKQVKGTNGLRTDIWKMDKPIQAYATMFAIGKYAVVKDKWRDKDVHYYVEPEYAPYARLMFKNTPEMMEYFSKRTGLTYPWNKYHQVVVRDYVSGAMENTTASLFGEFMNQNAREIADHNSEDVVSHELFHQWFGDYVTAESWSNVTVNESFANYSEQMWRTYKYGKASGDELAYNDLQGYLGSSSVSDPQLARFYYDSREDMFDAISYNKGGSILHYLNTLIGDAAFDKAMNLYLTRRALQSGEAHDWRLAVEDATGLDWNWFFNQWYYHAGHPAVRVQNIYNDTTQKLTLVVSQTQTDSTYMFRLPMKAAIVYGKDKTVADWVISKRTDTFTYAYRNGERPVVIVDYQHVVPMEFRDNKKPAQWLVQYQNCDDYVGKRQAVSGAGKSMSDSASQALIDLALNDKMKSIRRLALSQIQSTQSDKYKKKWTAKVTDMATNDSSNSVRSIALDILGDWKVAAAKPLMLKSLYDSSYFVAGSALDALAKLDKDTAYTLAVFLLPTDPKSTLEGNIWTLIGKKGADDGIKYYEQKIPHTISGGRKISMAFSLNNYLKAVKSDASFNKGIDLYVTMILNENMKSTRGALGGTLFQVVSGLKSSQKSDDKEEAATAERRIPVVKAALQKVVDAEKDPETLKDFKKMMKENFE